MLFERVFEGDINSEVPHVLINLFLCYIHTLLILFLSLDAFSYLGEIYLKLDDRDCGRVNKLYRRLACQELI
jgi:hypothetical protein